MPMKSPNFKRSAFFTLIFVVASWGQLFGETYNYRISCLGIRVVDINIMNNFAKDTGVLRVQADTYYITPIFPFLHNVYTTKYEDGFLPVTYEKHIDQRKYFEDRLYTYDQKNNTATLVDRLKKQKIYYPIMAESRDFFSALLYIASHLKDKDEVWLDANRLIWKATYVQEGREILKTPLGKIPAIKLKMRFKKISPEPQENTDMMTNQLVNEENTLYLWISDDSRHLPLKARYERKPFPVYWELITYKP
jgi:hypothetical protein